MGYIMDSFIDYINSSLPNDDNKTLYKFKRGILDEMTERANEVISRGINDRKVVSDLVISEYPNLSEDYKIFKEKDNSAAKSKRNLILNVVGSLVYIISLIVIFLAVSFITQKWAMTWVIVVDGILLWVSYLLSLGVNKVVKLRRIFHPIARILLALDVMTFSVAIFIFALAILHIHLSWVIIICGIVAMFIADALFSVITKQKLAIFSCLAYIPVVATMVFIITGALGILHWSIGWIMIPLSLFIDFAIIAVAIRRNFSYKSEEVDVWKES